MRDHITRLRLQCHRLKIDGRAHADVVVMRIKEASSRALAVGTQHLEEIVVGMESAGGVKCLRCAGERNTMHIDAAVLPRAGAARQPALIDQLAVKARPRSSDINEELKVISLMRARISFCVFGTCLR